MKKTMKKGTDEMMGQKKVRGKKTSVIKSFKGMKKKNFAPEG